MKWSLEAALRLKDSEIEEKLSYEDLKSLDRFLMNTANQRLRYASNRLSYEGQDINDYKTVSDVLLKQGGNIEFVEKNDVLQIEKADESDNLFSVQERIEDLRDYLKRKGSGYAGRVKYKEHTEKMASDYGINESVSGAIDILKRSGKWAELKEEYGGTDGIAEEIESIATDTYENDPEALAKAILDKYQGIEDEKNARYEREMEEFNEILGRRKR